MPIHFINPKKFVSSAFLKLPVSVENMERFSASLVNLCKNRNPERDEEYHKGEIWKFLRGIFEPDYSVQVKRPIDLAIFNGNDTNAKPAVIIEVKSPTNAAEMFSASKPNVKSLQELVYYFMLECKMSIITMLAGQVSIFLSTKKRTPAPMCEGYYHNGTTMKFFSDVKYTSFQSKRQ